MTSKLKLDSLSKLRSMALEQQAPQTSYVVSKENVLEERIRTTLHFYAADIDLIEKLRRYLKDSGIKGRLPDSAIVRFALRVAQDHLKTSDLARLVSESKPPTKAKKK